MSDDTHDTTGALEDLPCIELVELVTDYLDDALDADVRARFDSHLPYCEGCSSVLAQFREVVELSGRLTETDIEHVDADDRNRLLAAFREPREA